jgi:SAM-dependent methyltransferase
MNREMYELMYQAEETHFWYVGRRRVISTWFDRTLTQSGARQGRKLRLLDYGCGTGRNLLYFGEHSNAFGADMEPEAVRLCRKRGLDDVIQLDSADPRELAPRFAGQFDVITMLDVLEHIPDDVLALQRMHVLLKPDGRLLLTVPAYDWLWSGEDELSHHQRRYTAASLKQTAEAAGYSVLHCSYFNTILLPLQAAAAFAERMQRGASAPKSLVRNLPRALNTALLGAITVESMLLRRLALPFGASIICTLGPRATAA